MSKSLKLFGGASAGAIAVLLAGYNFADRNIAKVPANLPTLGALSPNAIAALEAEKAPAKVEVAQAETGDAARGGLVAAAYADEAGAGKNFGLGRAAHADEILAWDVDVRPNGAGLPDGSGNAFDGEEIFEENCASCHGSFAEGVDNWPKLAGGDGTLADEDPLKTVGSYWPYLSTVFDYVNRSMPFGNAQSLNADEVYAITAYILYSNDIIDDEFELSKETFLDVEMPNAGGFIVDDRGETEYAIWRAEPCMENCKDAMPEITMRATVLDVTPEEEAEPADQVAVEDAPVQETAVVEAAAKAVPADVVVAALDPAMVKAGEKVFKKCKACHQVGEGAKNRSGPQLNGVVGRAIGSIDGFKYSGTMADMGGEWTEEKLAEFLANPRGTVKGTRMAFKGLKKPEDIAAVTAYLKSFDP